MAPKRPADSLSPSIRIAPPAELKAYVVYEHELEILATGSPSSLYLNFSLFLIGTALSLVVALVTTPIPSDRVFYGFLIFCLVASISGVVLFALWWRYHESAKDLTSRIKNQMPPNPAIQERPMDSGG
jgi:hypothetical protein